MLKNCLRLGLMFSLALLLVAASVEAQVIRGGFRGIVTDESAGVLIGVTVTASSPSRIGDPAESVTNNMGLYRLENLPIGVYTATFTLPGFATLNRENIVVEVGRTLQVDIVLPLAGAEETVTVTAASPVIDTVHADYSTNFAQELVKNVPTTRNSYFDLLVSVPGVKADHSINISRFSIYGSNIDQNSYQYDGVDVNSVSSGGPWDYPNYDIIQEIEVLGVGASAEFSGFQGGVVNIVTRSGSNTWGGSGSYFLIDDWMVGNNTPEEEYPAQTDYRRDLSLVLGGPIIKDRLWVMGIYEYIQNRGVPIGVPLTDDISRNWESRPFFKVTAQFSQKDNFEFMYQNNIFATANNPSRTRPVEATSLENGDAPIISIRWNHLFSDSTLLEVKGGGMYVRDGEDPLSGDFDTAGRTDVATGFASVNYNGVWKSHQNKTQIAAALTHYADDFIKGSHDFKFGAQFVRSIDSSFWKYNGANNAYYYDYYGDNYYAVYREPSAYGANVDNNAVFVNDNWTLNSRVTLNLGLRFDHMIGGIPDLHGRDGTLENNTDVVFPGLGTLITFDNISPRLGMTVRLDEEGRTVAKGSYGRYYGRIAANWIKGQALGNQAAEARLWNEDTGLYDEPYWSWDPNFNLGTDPNLRNQYTDQFFVGFEREVVPDVRLDVSFIYKKENDFVRVKDVEGIYDEIPHLDEWDGESQILPVFDRVSPSEQSLYLSTNRDDFKKDYKSLVVQANRRWSGGWTMNGSYQWQRGLGVSGGGIQLSAQSFTNQGASGFGADPNDLTNAYGRLPSDGTHNIKLSTAFEAPYGIMTGIRYAFESGRPWARLIRVGGLGQGGQDVLATERGAYSLESAHQMGIRIDKDFVFKENMRLRLSFDIFNVLNRANPINVRNNSTQAGADFGESLDVPGPRRAQIGIRFEF